MVGAGKRVWSVENCAAFGLSGAMQRRQRGEELTTAGVELELRDDYYLLTGAVIQGDESNQRENSWVVWQAAKKRSWRQSGSKERRRTAVKTSVGADSRRRRRPVDSEHSLLYLTFMRTTAGTT